MFIFLFLLNNLVGLEQADLLSPQQVFGGPALSELGVTSIVIEKRSTNIHELNIESEFTYRANHLLKNKTGTSLCIPGTYFRYVEPNHFNVPIETLLVKDDAQWWGYYQNIIWEPPAWEELSPEPTRYYVLPANKDLSIHILDDIDWAFEFDVPNQGKYYHILSIHAPNCQNLTEKRPPFLGDPGPDLFSQMIQKGNIHSSFSAILEKHGGVLFWYAKEVVITQEDIDAANAKREAILKESQDAH